jgi:hypothetical protein
MKRFHFKNSLLIIFALIFVSTLFIIRRQFMDAVYNEIEDLKQDLQIGDLAVNTGLIEDENLPKVFCMILTKPSPDLVRVSKLVQLLCFFFTFLNIADFIQAHSCDRSVGKVV